MIPEYIWFDVALVLFIYAIGLVLFGHFEIRTPKPRRILKIVSFTLLTALLSAAFGRGAVLAMLALLTVAFLIIHGWYLPKHGINGLTGEPKEKYYALRGWKLDGPVA